MTTTQKPDIWHVLPRDGGQIVTQYHAQTPGAGEGECRRQHRQLTLRHDGASDQWTIYRGTAAVASGFGRTWPPPAAV